MEIKILQSDELSFIPLASCCGNHLSWVLLCHATAVGSAPRRQMENESFIFCSARRKVDCFLCHSKDFQGFPAVWCNPLPHTQTNTWSINDGRMGMKPDSSPVIAFVMFSHTFILYISLWNRQESKSKLHIEHGIFTGLGFSDRVDIACHRSCKSFRPKSRKYKVDYFSHTLKINFVCNLVGVYNTSHWYVSSLWMTASCYHIKL